jgi:serine/threonine-protein kinase
MTQVAGALDAAHARGLVHRDVKPSNILLAPAAGGAGEYCYLCDFGLIKQMHTDTDAGTATDQLVGSVPYVAPEQVEGAEVDGRTDVYSLGCAIFHCLAGSPPYQGRTDVEVVFAHLRGDPPPLSSRVAGLPPALDRVLARAMARDKQDRYLTCSALVAAAADVLARGAGCGLPWSMTTPGRWTARRRGRPACRPPGRRPGGPRRRPRPPPGRWPRWWGRRPRSWGRRPWRNARRTGRPPAAGPAGAGSRPSSCCRWSPPARTWPRRS